MNFKILLGFCVSGVKILQMLLEMAVQNCLKVAGRSPGCARREFY